MNASELFVQCLENEGVEYIFGVPGEENLAFLDALSRSERIKLVVTRHEQGAAFMANVYGRLSTYPGVCLATLGPGATNLITGVADAQLDRAPVVAITGQAGLDRIFKESHQYLDVIGLFRSVTKWNARVEKADTVPEIVRKAFRVARLEKPGATHIELPEDVAEAPAEGAPMPIRRTTYPVARPESITKAFEIISGAKRPVILAGNGVIRRQAADALAEFAHRVRIPVATTFMGKGALDYRDDLSLPAMGLRSPEASLGVLGDADVVVAVGYDLVEWEPSVWNPHGAHTIVHIDSTAAELDRDYLPATEVVGEIGESLRALTGRFEGEAPQWDWRQYRAPVEDESAGADNAFPMHPRRILWDLRRVLGDDDVVISDVGVHKLWVATRFRTARPNSVVIPNGLASMGLAVPGAVAAKLVHPDRKVVAVTGDGGFMMNSQELETAQRMKTPLVVVVLVDNRYGVIELNQQRKYGRSFGVEFGNPDFVAYAASFGLPGFQVTAAQEFEPTLRRALDMPTPALVAVPVNSREAPSLFA